MFKRSCAYILEEMKQGVDINMENWHELDIDTTEEVLQTSRTDGLSVKEVIKRQKQNGKNEMTIRKKQSHIILFVKQFQDFIIFILLAATTIAALLGEFIDAIAIISIVLLNAVIGFFQERKAEQALEKLKQLAAPKMLVYRDKRWQNIAASEAVQGDLITLKTGDRVPADVRIVKSNYLATEEAALTGESELVEKSKDQLAKKDAAIHEQSNICFKGTLVMRGNGQGIIVRTGMQTELGKIARMMDTIETSITPLQWRLAQLGKVLVITVLLLTALTVLIGIYHGNPIYHMFLAGISLAVAVIPEGLPAIVTVALSIGVQRMMKRKVIVRKLAAVETLGCATIICTDKTGTITENKMTVEQISIGREAISMKDTNENQYMYDDKRKPLEHKMVKQLFIYSMLCNDASLYVKKGKYSVEGNSTDGALLIAGRNLGINEKQLASYKIVEHTPFDSRQKQMRVQVKNEHKQVEIIKGAPEMIIPRCNKMFHLDGRTIMINEREMMKQVKDMSEQALRVIAICIRTMSDNPFHGEETILVGLVGIVDPPRKEVKQSLTECKQAGIETMMITGDHPQTAAAIGRKVGLDYPNKKMLTGEDIENRTFEQLVDEIDDVSIVARVNPAQKLTIVRALQEKGHVVAMTGDGINDAPAMKASNIGISMGMTGTDVTKEAAHIILMDDNFVSIKEAIKEGRHVYTNIRKFIRYLLTSNVGEIFIMLVALLMAYPLPLIPVQILWVNLVTDGLPAIALGLEKSEKDVMKQKPRHPKESIFAKGLSMKIMTRGICIGIVSLIAFMYTYNVTEDLTYARTMAFTTLVMAQLIHVYDCRSERGIWKQNPFTNIPLLFAVSSSLFLLIFVVYDVRLQYVFQTIPLTGLDWIYILGLSLIPSTIFIKKSNKK